MTQDSGAVDFTGQVVIVTGAGGGLGSAIAREIARRGAAVIANDLGGPVTGGAGAHDHRFADHVVEAITAAGGRAIASYDDIAGEAGARRVVALALSQFGRIDAVIANAGTMRFGAFEAMSLADLQALLAVHVGGAWTIAQAAWPHMRAAGYGRLVFATSSAGMLGNAMLSAYGAAKGAVMGLMHGLSEAGRGHGILCNAYMPNAITRMTEGIGASDLGDNPWSMPLAACFDPAYAAGLVSYLASAACVTTHGIYSSLGGRIGRAFIGITDGVTADGPIDAETVAAQWPRIGDPERGYTIPSNNTDEWRIVAEQRGL